MTEQDEASAQAAVPHIYLYAVSTEHPTYGI